MYYFLIQIGPCPHMVCLVWCVSQYTLNGWYASHVHTPVELNLGWQIFTKWMLEASGHHDFIFPLI